MSAVEPDELLLFGGAFDPIHNGHLFIAEAARQALGLARVLFLPNRAPRHRGGPAAAPEARAEMVRLAIAGNPAFALDETDLEPESSGYTVDLLQRIRARHAGKRLSFLVGGDSIVDSSWHRFDVVLAQLERFAVAPRGGAAAMTRLRARIASVDPALRARIVVLDGLPLVPVSATVIRAELAAGRSARYLLPEPVWRYVRSHGLYAAGAAGPPGDAGSRCAAADEAAPGRRGASARA